ncbi:MAG: tRNA 2-selenouridine(34) synthase MnmH [Marinilabiliaceae bacterium]|nr:tRNA 2-selenouridine(34) synthase MnmH [Marinilabiliaceae bacterium]
MKKLAPKEFLKEAMGTPVIDVRSPGEFEEGHIPNAINMPLFTNEERAIVGTLYKRTGKDAAVLKGLEIVGPKMVDFARQAGEIAIDKQLLVHCWRGGMRSESMAWLFERTGLQCGLLIGGYKGYRNHLMEQMESIQNLIVIEGHTGSGKTEILSALAARGEQIIDLEGLACHRGSAFGGIGQAPQPTTQQFQNDLYQAFSVLQPELPIWVEGESKTIGKVYLPDPFWHAMNQSRVIEIEVPLKARVSRLVDDYAGLNADAMKQSISRLERRLGNKRMTEILEYYQNQNFHKVAELLLEYYDKTYQHSTETYREQYEVLNLADGNAQTNAALLIKQNQH